jgi:hypothetical protein
MTENGSLLRLWIALPAAIVVGILNVFLFFLFMVLYSYVINPGHDETFYQEAASRFGPYASIVGGIPLMFLAGRWIAKRLGPAMATAGAVAIWTIYFLVDVSIVAASGFLLSLLPLVATSFLTKLIAIILGARTAFTKGAKE